MEVTPAAVNRMLAREFPALTRDGYSCVGLGDGEAITHWRHNPDELRPGGYIPGPTQFALADLALWCVVFTVIGITPMAVTTDLSMSFLRPATDGDLMAHCRLLRAGSTRIHGTVELWVDPHRDRLVSHATGAFSRPG